MSLSPATHAYEEVIELINRFLEKPPAGVPDEILQALGMLDRKTILPPQLFLETVEQAPVAISITDANARILYANSAFEKLTGYAREEVIGSNESVLSSKSTPASVYHELWTTIKNAKVWQGKLVNHRKGGIEYLAELTISPVLNSQGKVAYFLGMHRDISEWHRMQQQLEFQKGLIEAALDAAPMVVAMIDADRKLLLDNSAYKALRRDLKGIEPAQLFLDAFESQLGVDLKELMGRGQGFTNRDIQLETPGTHEPRWFICSGAPIAELGADAASYFREDNSADCRLLLIANEVTQSRKRINEARLNMIRASMAEQQTVQTMREAISASIFKMQAPVNIIKAALSMSSSGDRAVLKPVLQQALDSGEEAIESLHNSLPGVRSEDSSSINLNELIHEVLHLSTRSLLSNGVVVDWRAAPVLPSLNGRANALRGLFKYLLDNAIQALIQAGGDQREIRLETSVQDGDLVVAIMDNGVGLEESEAIKVFEPFYCGWEDPRQHAGMGLTMAQEVAINHGGCIHIDRQFVGGLRVFVQLPFDQDEG